MADKVKAVKVKKKRPSFAESGRENPFDKYFKKEDWFSKEVKDYLNEKYPDILFWHTPNEGKRTPFDRYKATFLGIKSGVLDIVIAEPKFILEEDFELFLYAGLFIELKIEEEVISEVKKVKRIKRGVISDTQKAMIDKLIERDYLAVVCYNIEQVKTVVDDYFKDNIIRNRRLLFDDKKIEIKKE